MYIEKSRSNSGAQLAAFYCNSTLANLITMVIKITLEKPLKK